MERSCANGSEWCDWCYFICWDIESDVCMTSLSEDVLEIWSAKTYQVYQSNPMLSWEACEMIAWHQMTKSNEVLDNEDLDR